MARTKNYTERAYEFIRSQIDNNVWLPDTHLKEIEIAENLGISRTPVRRAMNRLQEEGYLNIEAYKGATVAQRDLTSQAVVDRLQFLELLLGHLFLQLQNKGIQINEAEIDRRYQAIQLATEHRDIKEYMRFKQQLFDYVVSFNANSYFRQIALTTFQCLNQLWVQDENKKTLQHFDFEIEKGAVLLERLIEALKKMDYPNANKQARIWINELILEEVNC
ncbi:MAG: winged helix-turn-helix domain-containing protein [Aerococcus sp.]|nr:winged helix-turn-helix domain-containing protein [Aerococcus sp.]